jgi:hypothetical protein
MLKNRTAGVVAVTVMLAFFGACSASGSSGPGTVAPTTIAASVTLPPVTPAPTLVPPVTAPSTTVAPRAFLRSDGAGPFDFGATYSDTLAGMPLSVLSDDGFSFPVASGIAGYFDSADASKMFHFPSARKVCWDDGGGGGICAFFGGVDATSLLFVGWEYGSSVGLGVLYSASGVTANILVTDVPTMPLPDGDCYGDTGVALDGIGLTLASNTDEWFGTYADDGTFVPTVPWPAAATVTRMSTGDSFYYDEPDC